ncbi:hypothetical protein BdWA1_001170 [Babesia duncani]|uniref:Uncharacterized protein n=1 Tax=Babesia duncani TaxID=323732 RepID=A0AAD9UQK9_9APIC|nr:hypothetical protein BdWA1_001170 [Babesia duncani]
MTDAEYAYLTYGFYAPELILKSEGNNTFHIESVNFDGVKYEFKTTGDFVNHSYLPSSFSIYFCKKDKKNNKISPLLFTLTAAAPGTKGDMSNNNPFESSSNLYFYMKGKNGKWVNSSLSVPSSSLTLNSQTESDGKQIIYYTQHSSTTALDMTLMYNLHDIHSELNSSIHSSSNSYTRKPINLEINFKSHTNQKSFIYKTNHLLSSNMLYKDGGIIQSLRADDTKEGTHAILNAIRKPSFSKVNARKITSSGEMEAQRAKQIEESSVDWDGIGAGIISVVGGVGTIGGLIKFMQG